MNLSPSWTEFFLRNDIEAIHWSAVGRAMDPVSLIFDYARLHNYIVFTNDLDFGSILAATNANQNITEQKCPKPDTFVVLKLT